MLSFCKTAMRPNRNRALLRRGLQRSRGHCSPARSLTPRHRNPWTLPSNNFAIACILNVEGDWHSLDRADTGELITLAQSSDLVIIGQAKPDARPAPAWRPDEIVVCCGRPVLMVPYIGSYPQVGRRVLVAWDGSGEAVRALNDALPLMRSADEVTVMIVRSRAKDLEPVSTSMERIVRHLARHGIAARTAQALNIGSTISDELLSRSVDLAADLIVAGAYHHSQLRETLLGGVSRELFRHMTLPVLMAH